MKSRTTLVLVFASLAFLMNCKKESESVQATIEVSIMNVGFTSWKVVSVNNSAGFAMLETNNTPFMFEKGRRYRITSLANVAVHPFEFRSGTNEVMLSQNPMNPGMLANDASVRFSVEGSSISFTVSDSFMKGIATYNCANHNGMKGEVKFN